MYFTVVGDLGAATLIDVRTFFPLAQVDEPIGESLHGPILTKPKQLLPLKLIVDKVSDTDACLERQLI